MLTRVTITGADDGVDPNELVKLSEEFPFVEWGILLSPKRTGTLRYPSADWISNLCSAVFNDKKLLNLSAHFCGQYARDTMAGDDRWLPVSCFRRIQLNGFSTSSASTFVPLIHKHTHYEFIFQVGSELEIQPVAHLAQSVGNASLLFDPSGGRGIEAFRWPITPFGVRMGYAGGIKPSNIEDVLRDIGVVDSPYWVDMESGVRTDDKFDLDLVRQVLEKTAPYVVVDGR